MTRMVALYLAIGLLWLSAIVITYGTYLQSNSQQFGEYQKQISKELIEANPEQDLGSGIGVGLALNAFWPFVAICYGFIAAMYTCSISLVIYHFKRKIISIISFILSLVIYSCSILVNIHSAKEHFNWQFITLGIGELLWILSLSLCLISTIINCLAFLRRNELK